MKDDNHVLLGESNTDWAATVSIYGEAPGSTRVKPLRDQSNGGFCGCILIHIPISKVAFARRVTPNEDFYRYFSLEKNPVIRIEFEYLYDSQVDGGEEELNFDTPPTSLNLKWDHFPDEWPVEEKNSLLSWLSKRSKQLLQDEEISFSVCEFCEHETLSYWETFHQDTHCGYRLIFLPPKMDLLYHSNIGTKIHPKDVARRERQQDETTKRPPPENADEYARRTLIRKWRSLYTDPCPICFDTMRYSQFINLPCGDFLCQDCLPMYLKMKVTEIQTYRKNPFLCPLEKCRQELPIIGFCKRHLSKDDMDRVRKWIKDLKFPPCFSLDRCLSPACAALGSMRKRPNTLSFVYCDVCDKTWCEYCLKRIPVNVKYSEHMTACDGEKALVFSQRYLTASDHQKEKCREKYPWIVSYAHSRAHDGEAMVWMLKNGQFCPSCQTGIERIEGCFHMKCPTCATHFCYECGETLLPPYYGTHHCWERNNIDIM